MNEPQVFKYEDKQLIPKGPLQVEMQTPEQFIAHSPLVEQEEHHWGKYVVRIVYMKEQPEHETPRLYYAIAQRARDDGHGMEARWALIQFDTEDDLVTFRANFKEYCLKTS